MLALVAVAAVAVGCQGWDRLEPDTETAPEASRIAGAGTGSGMPDPTPREVRQQLSGEAARQRLAQIEGASGAQRLSLAERLVQEFPEAQAIPRFHQLVGEAHLALGDPAAAAEAFQREVALMGGDLLGLPLDGEAVTRLGWALYQAGNEAAGIDWLVRATFLGTPPKLLEALRFVHADRVGGPEGFGAWLQEERRSRAVTAPAFALPGYQQETVRLLDALGPVTLINFWSPT